jgi:hypothetical protein
MALTLLAAYRLVLAAPKLLLVLLPLAAQGRLLLPLPLKHASSTGRVCHIFF